MATQRVRTWATSAGGCVQWSIPLDHAAPAGSGVGNWSASVSTTDPWAEPYSISPGYPTSSVWSPEHLTRPPLLKEKRLGFRFTDPRSNEPPKKSRFRVPILSLRSAIERKRLVVFCSQTVGRGFHLRESAHYWTQATSLPLNFICGSSTCAILNSPRMVKKCLHPP